ncbi:2-hydroxyacid dehydrogenase [Rubrivivax sp. RP6-9]|uniref:2-hydroxyacid dehydrogenase n=1 Tax=Rubrivivax sp. RP6-9 TaxID=3415750 RepID=UPI003CC63B41
MQVLLAGEIDADWRQALAAALPEATWVDDAAGAAEADAAIVANPPPGALAHAPRLRLIQSLWAGVDRLLDDTTLPAGVPVVRMVDPVMNRTMAETVLWAVLSLHRGFFTYARQQRLGLWRQHALRHADAVPVLVLGQGEMGRTAAAVLQAQGYRVSGWRRGVALAPLLATHEIVVNLLPLTPATRGLLDAAFFAALPRGASLVNLGRGPHVVDADLLAALDSGQLAHAVLDVFHQEPLPPEHRFWTHDGVTLLPHVAAATSAHSASAIAAANLRALRDGRPIAHLVDRARGY